MSRLSCAVAAIVFTAAADSANAFVFSLTPVTNTTPNFAGTILIQGTVTVGAGETFYSPTVVSSIAVPFTAGLTAGFNALPQGWDPAFLAWNGLGTYSGPIYDHSVNPSNLGYAGGMPLGLYGSNPFGPGGLSGLTLGYVDLDGLDQSAPSTYAINVVPTPGAMALVGVGGVLVARRRR
jgi:hypothetical protein